MCKPIQTLDASDRTIIMRREAECRRLAAALKETEIETRQKIETIKDEIWTHLISRYPSVKEHPCAGYAVDEKEGIVFEPCFKKLMSETLQGILVAIDEALEDDDEEESKVVH